MRWPRGERRSELVRYRSDRKSTRLNSSHSQISYAVFCLKKKKIRDKLRCRLAYARARLHHILVLEVPDIDHSPRSPSPGGRRNVQNGWVTLASLLDLACL